MSSGPGETVERPRRREPFDPTVAGGRRRTRDRDARRPGDSADRSTVEPPRAVGS